jgi:hypothetical protein
MQSNAMIPSIPELVRENNEREKKIVFQKKMLWKI